MAKKRPRGRRTGGGGDTRSTIGRVARELFAADGYAGATVRAIARAASVDPALVHHYFGSKRELYTDVMRLGDARLDAELETTGERGARSGTHGEYIVGAVLEAWDRPDAAAALAALLRSSSSDPPARVRLDALLRDAIARPLAQRLDGARALTRVRSALVAAQLVGLAWARYVAKSEPLATTSARRLVHAYGPALDAVLDGSDFAR